MLTGTVCGQELFYKFISNFTNKLVKQLLSMTVEALYERLKTYPEFLHILFGYAWKQEKLKFLSRCKNGIYFVVLIFIHKIEPSGKFFLIRNSKLFVRISKNTYKSFQKELFNYNLNI